MIVCGIDPGLGGALAVLNDVLDCETIAMPTMGEKSQKIVDGGAVARFLGEHNVEFAVIELKESYWKQACNYLDQQDRQADMFRMEAAE